MRVWVSSALPGYAKGQGGPAGCQTMWGSVEFIFSITTNPQGTALPSWPRICISCCSRWHHRWASLVSAALRSTPPYKPGAWGTVWLDRGDKEPAGAAGAHRGVSHSLSQKPCARPLSVTSSSWDLRQVGSLSALVSTAVKRGLTRPVCNSLERRRLMNTCKELWRSERFLGVNDKHVPAFSFGVHRAATRSTEVLPVYFSNNGENPGRNKRRKGLAPGCVQGGKEELIDSQAVPRSTHTGLV